MSVCGTGTISISLEVFLGSLIRITIQLAEAARYYRHSAKVADLPTTPIPNNFNELFRQFADLSLLRLSIAIYASTRILTSYPSNTPFGFSLGPD